MKVILQQDVKGLGKKESMVNVSDGYARNFLLPKGLAVEANSTNMNVMKTRNDAEKTRKDRELAKAQALADTLKGKVVVIKTRAGESGKLFGSISNKEIADRIKSSYSLDIDKKQVILPEAIRSLGTAEVDIKLYPGVSTRVTVSVEAE
jgi:large subunit ribosomal protein L9